MKTCPKYRTFLPNTLNITIFQAHYTMRAFALAHSSAWDALPPGIPHGPLPQHFQVLLKCLPPQETLPDHSI